MTLYEGGPLTTSLPCVLHLYHSPVSIVNELHHVLPLYLQKQLQLRVPDKTVVPLCGTGHSNVHAAITAYFKTGFWPAWCVGKTRDLAERAVFMYLDSGGKL